MLAHPKAGSKCPQEGCIVCTAFATRPAAPTLNAPTPVPTPAAATPESMPPAPYNPTYRGLGVVGHLPARLL
mgnify:CR=1 FL=1